MTDNLEQYKAMRDDIGTTLLRREVILASGPDAFDYLQGQLSQDLTSLENGSSTWSWLLQPHGKVDALLRITRTGETEYLLDFDAGFTELVLERLNRFKLRTKIDFQPTDWKVLAVRGANAKKPAKSGSVVADLNWPTLSGYDLIGESPEPPKGAVDCDFNVYEALRIEAGVPALGAELDQLTIPAEAGINDITVSFTKGCYTGQELIARIDSRGGNVPRNLRLIIIDTDDPPENGAKVLTNDSAAAASKPLGLITSSAFSPLLGKTVGLAMIRRELMAPADAVVVSLDGTRKCRVEKLPLQS